MIYLIFVRGKIVEAEYTVTASDEFTMHPPPLLCELHRDTTNSPAAIKEAKYVNMQRTVYPQDHMHLRCVSLRGQSGGCLFRILQ